MSAAPPEPPAPLPARAPGRVWLLHLLVLGALALVPALAGPYTQGNFARVLVLAVYATGYNIAFGYTGLLSLGHALFFAAGMYALGMGTAAMGMGAGAGILAGALAGALGAGLIGILALRTTGVSFMIVTMMFAQAGYLTILYFTPWTRGDEGIVLAAAARRLGPFDLAQDGPRYAVALALYAAALLASLVLARSGFGRVLVAVRENPERTLMLGYDPIRLRLAALMLSGLFAGASGAAYAALFGYVGASFAAIPYSILPLLWVLLGGAGTTLGPLMGVTLMFYLIDWASGITTAYLFLVGLALVILVMFAPKGILGTIREKGGTVAAVTLLSARGLTRHFGGLRAVDGVDFDLEPGEIHALIGPNGAGKTTFVGLLSGRIPAQSGVITFDGADITRMPAHARVRRGIAYTFQITAIYPRLTVRDNALIAAHGDPARAGAALGRVGLAEESGRAAGTLSYGHQRLLEVAMGLALAPRLLILDEPTQGLAASEIGAFKALVKSLVPEMSVLLIEHNMDVVMDLADRITVLNFGRWLATGTPAEIRSDPQVQAAYLGEAMLELRDLRAGYGAVEVLTGMSFSVATGEVLCLMGRNGAGKTTTLRAIMGQVQVTAGEIVLAGQRLDGLPAHQVALQGVGYVPQGRRLWGGLTVAENLAVGLMARGRGEAVLDRVLGLFPRLRERLDQPARTLSGGEQQMLAIGRALCLEPRVLLLDEPTEGLQPSMIALIGDTVRALRGMGVAVVLVEQRVDAAIRLADRVGFVQGGRIAALVEAARLTPASAEVAAYVGV